MACAHDNLALTSTLPYNFGLIPFKERTGIR
jgi:hypothetical protein